MVSWDTVYVPPLQAADALHWISDRLDTWNGHPWVINRETVLVAGDYSSIRGYGAFFPGGEMSPISLPMSAQDESAVESNCMSSTVGELKAVLYTLQTIIHSNLALIRGKTLHYQTDNEGAVASLNSMAGNVNTFPWVKLIWDTARQPGVDAHIVLSRHPRETLNQQEADRLSKLTDNSAWVLSDAVFQHHDTGTPMHSTHCTPTDSGHFC